MGGDGKPKLIISGTTKISVFKNNSVPGHFALLPAVTIANPIYSYFVTTAVMDGDSKLHILVPCNLSFGYNISHIYIYKNVSTSAGIAFAPPITFTANGGYAITTADMGGNGKPDVR